MGFRLGGFGESLTQLIHYVQICPTDELNYPGMKPTRKFCRVSVGGNVYYMHKYRHVARLGFGNILARTWSEHLYHWSSGDIFEPDTCLKKNQNAPGPSEHPPVRG